MLSYRLGTVNDFHWGFTCWRTADDARRTTTDNHWPQQLTMSTSCSGELKKSIYGRVHYSLILLSTNVLLGCRITIYYKWNVGQYYSLICQNQWEHMLCKSRTLFNYNDLHFKKCHCICNHFHSKLNLFAQ